MTHCPSTRYAPPFIEHPEPSRSDAHTWSASPNYYFLATIAGIRPDSPGFSSLLIEPKPGDLECINAANPHSLGEIHVELEVNGNRLIGSVSLLKDWTAG